MKVRLLPCCLALALGSFLPPAGVGFGQDPVKPGAKSNEQPHWAFQSIQRPSIPKVRDAAWVRSPVDAFVLARQAKAGQKPAPPADPRTLLRRVYLDLIGLPPTPEEQSAFLKDPSPQAYTRVVDYLLSRPQYGERWARHWLDVVRYAESNGYERDGARPSTWRYRDYVIDSLNRDKPYDRFVKEQLAGDEIEGSDAETQIATTFLRLGTWDDEPADPMVDRYDQLDDVLGTTATAFLGLTLRCARCHDHKFEPFTQEDYYGMLAVFEPLKRPEVIVSATHREEHERCVGSEAELAALQKSEAAIANSQKQIDALRLNIWERLIATPKTGATSKENATADFSPEVIAAFRTASSQRNQKQQALVKVFGPELEKAVRTIASDDERARLDRFEYELFTLREKRPELPHAYIWYEDSPRAPVTRIFRRGDPKSPQKEVGPRLPAILVKESPSAPRPTTKSTGRRLWLARWITAPGNPLTARVMANRIWQHHFGEGLVASANDFGVKGDPPSDRELLDWLASEFVAGGWRMKPLHRMIVLSNAYQMSSATGPGPASAEVKGAALGRWRQRRLEAEAVRDSVLAVSGRLNPQMAGPSIYPPIPAAVLQGQSRPGAGWGKSDERQAARRSIYIFVKRVLAVPELELLDAPDTSSSCEKRAVSTTGPQALTFLNGEFMQQQARHFAARLQHEAGSEPRAQVERAFELALCRPPRPEEMRLALDFLTRQERLITEEADKTNAPGTDARRKALEAFCLVLLNTNEFVYLS